MWSDVAWRSRRRAAVAGGLGAVGGALERSEEPWSGRKSPAQSEEGLAQSEEGLAQSEEALRIGAK